MATEMKRRARPAADRNIARRQRAIHRANQKLTIPGLVHIAGKEYQTSAMTLAERTTYVNQFRLTADRKEVKELPKEVLAPTPVSTPSDKLEHLPDKPKARSTRPSKPSRSAGLATRTQRPYRVEKIV